MSVDDAVNVSFVAPAHNERECVAALVAEIAQAAEALQLAFEIIVVDDRSTDGTAQCLIECAETFPSLRVVSITPDETHRPAGQSAAFAAGIAHARGELIVTLDADGQNDPADTGGLLETMRSSGADLVQGDRTAARQDSPWRRFGSWVGRMGRRLILGDTIRDTGCSLRVMRREVALALPLEYRGMHRFIPVLSRGMGFIVVEHPVRHRPRAAGRTKYGNLSRAVPGLIDCLAVRWMLRRRVIAEAKIAAPPLKKPSATRVIESKPRSGTKAGRS